MVATLAVVGLTQHRLAQSQSVSTPFMEIAQVLQSPRCMNCHPAGDAPLQTDESRREDLAVEGLGRASFQRTILDEDVPPEGAWYYARIVQVDGEIAWSSPIWVQPSDD